MKPDIDTTWLAEQVQAAAERLGLDCDRAQAGLIAAHTASVLRFNAQINLTRITEPASVLRLHIIDSLLWMLHVEGPYGDVIDLGSGAGYPGIPVAIVSGAPMTLCESIKKKAHFLEDVVSDLELPIVVYSGRAEELASEAPMSADTVIARAVSSLSALVELSAPLLSPRGRLVALKGTIESGELEAAASAAALCGLHPEAVIKYSLPGGGESRSVAVYRRVREPAVKLPRRQGMAQSKPLR